MGGPARPRDLVQREAARAAEQDRPDVTARRGEWRARQPGRDPDRLVSPDETWVKPNMTPGYGWGPTHRRVVEAVPHGHWKTITFVAALRATGLLAPAVVGGAANGDLFRAHVERHLAPAPRPGDVVVVDNRPSHEVAGVAAAIERAGAAVAYLPPYPPDRNPIERVLAKAEAEIRRQEPRTVAGTEGLRGEALDWFPASECQNYTRHAGYGPQGSD